MDSEETIGQRLRELREARGKSQAVIAGLAGITESYLSMLETGKRPLNGLKLFHALADALEIAPSELARLPLPAPGNGHTDSGIEAVRRALAAVDQGAPGGLIVPFDVLRDRVERLRTARRACRLRDVRAELPGVIRDLHTTIEAGRGVGDLLQLAVVLHVHVTLMWLRDAGAPADLRREVARLARNLAQEHGEMATMCLATWGRVNALRGAGMFDLAAAELNAATLPAVSEETVDLVGTLLDQRAAVAAAENRSADADAAIAEAMDLAQRFEETDRGLFWFGFNAAGLDLKRMTIALEADEPDTAAHIAETMQPQQVTFRTRESAYWLDYGRAVAQLPRRHDDAVRALRNAERVFPNRVYRNPLAREAIAGLLRRSRGGRAAEELRGLAHRAGLIV